MKVHLTEIVRKDNELFYKKRKRFDPDANVKVSYRSNRHSKMIAQKMAELNQIPEEFKDIIRDFANDLRNKLV